MGLETKTRCGCCGKFINIKDKDVDSYTPHRNSTDMEPPDNVVICGKCSREWEERLVKSFRAWKGTSSYAPNWIKSKAEVRAMKRLGFVLASSPSDHMATKAYVDPKNLPDGYTIEKQ